MKTAEYLFESSWEVCNKVGGIYTVVKSKAGVMKENYKNYFLIGPYIKTENFEEKEVPVFLQPAFQEMKSQGIKCHFGTWMIESEPDTILVEFDSLKGRADEIKKWLWDNYRVDSLKSQWDFTEPMLWSWAVGMLMEKLCGLHKKEMVLHCHEWLAGFSILYLKKHCKYTKTVFTTHATMLGRAMAGSGVDIYEMLRNMNPDQEALNFGVAEKYTTEKACAQTADVFTTVSEITGLEAEHILGRKPDVLLNNGLQVEKFPTVEENSLKHFRNREIIREFIAYFFFPYYTFDLDHNLIFYIVGRYEYKNKGLDILIDSLGKLNEKLKKENSNRTITMFFWIPMNNSGRNKEVMENKNYYSHIKNTLEWNSEKIMKKLLYDTISQSCSMEESIFTSDYLNTLKKSIKQFKRSGNPPLSTHDIPDNDPIVTNLRRVGLDNKEDDRVKVVLYPVYLDGNDALLNLPYYEALSGAHLGIFPSYYEPWGYTPLESMSLSVPAVTTDLAGFGIFIKPHLMKKDPGVFVLDRFKKSREEVIENLYKILANFSDYDHAERVQNKINAKSMSQLADWEHFVKNYIAAHNLALKR